VTATLAKKVPTKAPRAPKEVLLDIPPASVKRKPLQENAMEDVSPISQPQTPVGSFLRAPFLQLAADVVDDLERVRNANQNRLRQLTRTETDADGIERGFGLDIRHPDVARLAALVDRLEEAYADSVKNLERLVKAHPLWPWAQAQSGIGAKQFARLLAAVGDPYWHDGQNRPRTLYELYAYCGLDPVNGVGRRRKRGEKACWNDTAKMRVYLIAESCMKRVAMPERQIVIRGQVRQYAATEASPYRVLYEQAREKYENSTHDVEPCIQCGTKGKPAPVGTDLRDGHKNQRALRIVAKRILSDLYDEAKRLHNQQGKAGKAA
jgi:hypothetical protein